MIPPLICEIRTEVCKFSGYVGEFLNTYQTIILFDYTTVLSACLAICLFGIGLNVLRSKFNCIIESPFAFFILMLGATPLLYHSESLYAGFATQYLITLGLAIFYNGKDHRAGIFFAAFISVLGILLTYKVMEQTTGTPIPPFAEGFVILMLGLMVISVLAIRPYIFVVLVIILLILLGLNFFNIVDTHQILELIGKVIGDIVRRFQNQ